MKLSRISDIVAATLLVISLKTLAPLSVVTVLSMGYLQYALENIGETQDYMDCVIGMTGTGWHRAKGKKRVCLKDMDHA